MSTAACESKTFTLDLTLLTADYILLQLEKHKNMYSKDLIFALMFSSCWQEINKYYNLTDKTPIYLAALVYLSRKWDTLRRIGRLIKCS
jgi:hypothetical protein